MIRPVCQRIAVKARTHGKHFAHVEHLGVVTYATFELLELHALMLVMAGLIAGAGWLIIIFKAEG